MAFKANLPVLVTLAGLMAASALVTDALHNRLWANLAFGCLILASCLAFLLRLQPKVLQDPVVVEQRNTSRTESLSVLVDQVPMPLLRFSPGQGMLAINRAARSLFRTDGLIADPPQTLLDAVVRSDPGAPGSLSVFGRTYAVGISEIRSEEEAIRLVSLTDIQSEVRMAEATALKDLLRVLSHEIMNSLTPVASLASTARAYLEGETSPASRSALQALDVLSQRASGLAHFVEAYRSMARLPDPVFRPVEIGPLLRDIVRVFELSVAAKGVSIALDVPANIPSLDLDETLLTQALLNVLTNAAEATTALPGPGRIRLSVTHDRDEVRISISDNGCGVADSLAEQIFHAFVTTKASGTGTGLNLARQIALAHGGDLVFLGRNDAWSSVFCFILRVSPKLLGVH